MGEKYCGVTGLNEVMLILMIRVKLRIPDAKLSSSFFKTEEDWFV